MNHIILLWEDIRSLCDIFVIEENNPNVGYLIMQHLQVGDNLYYRRNRDYIYICTPEVTLKAEGFADDPRDIFVKKIEINFPNTFYEELPVLQKLPGQWSVVSKSEWYKRKSSCSVYDEYESRVALLAEPDLYAYMDDWRMLDQYNDKILKDMDNKKMQSRCSFSVSSQEGKELVLLLEQYPYFYEKDMQVEIQNVHNKSEKYRGIVTKRIEPMSLKVEFADDEAINAVAFSKDKYQISISNQGMITNFNRQKKAMEKLFLHKSVNPKMGDILLKKQKGTWEAEKISSEKLQPYLERFDENEAQKEAFIHALQAKDIYLIQGPPGTGKTTVITELVNYITAHNQIVLLSSCSHVAVDNVLERIEKKSSIIPIRLGKEEDISPEVKKYTLSSSARELQENILYRLEQQKIYEEDKDSFAENLKKEYQADLEALEQKIQKKKEKYNLLNYSNEDLNYIKDYLKLNSRCREVYRDLEEMKITLEQVRKEYAGMENEYQKCVIEQGVIQKQCQTIFHSGVKEQKKKELQSLERKSQELKRKIEESSLMSVEAKYKKMLDQYARMTSDVLYTREILQKKRQDGKEPLSVYVHRIQGPARDVQYLLRQKRKKEKAKSTFIRKEKERFAYRKELLEKTIALRQEWQEKIPYINDQIEDIYMELSNVVGATCNGIASFENQIFSERAYDYVIIDEAAHCNTLDVLIPLTMGKKVICVGDQNQLYPMLPSIDTEGGKGENSNPTKEEKEEIQKLREICKNTLFKQLYEERLPEESKTMLNVQYRMTPQIGSYISKEFYSGRLLNGIEKRPSETEFMQSALLWLDTGSSKESMGKQGRSYKNEIAAQMILNFLHQVDDTLYEEKTAGIICYYRLQADEISALLEKHTFRYLHIECDTIDAFQGKEKDIIVIDLVRTQNYTRFVDDANRLNVAVSRAKEMAVMAASVSYIQKRHYELLERLYYHIKERGGLMDGNIYRT